MPLFPQLLLASVLSLLSVLGLPEASAASSKKIALEPFTAVYKAKFNGFSVTATRVLAASGSDWQLDFSVESMLANIHEYSRFSIKNNQLQPLHYQYRRTGLGKNRHTVLDFDAANHSVINRDNSRYSLKDVPAAIQDRLSYQLQLALDLAAGKSNLTYAVADGRKVRQYTFRLVASERVQTPIGPVEAIKVARVRSDGERATNIWFAPDWNYALVKLAQREASGKRYQIVLTSLSLNGSPVKGQN